MMQNTNTTSIWKSHDDFEFNNQSRYGWQYGGVVGKGKKLLYANSITLLTSLSEELASTGLLILFLELCKHHCQCDMLSSKCNPNFIKMLFYSPVLPSATLFPSLLDTYTICFFF